MGGEQSKPTLLLQKGSIIDNYPIRLNNKQQAIIFNAFMNSKTTLTWKDVIIKGNNITFRKCVEANIDIQKLFNMQPDFEEWVKHNKACIEDCKVR